MINPTSNSFNRNFPTNHQTKPFKKFKKPPLPIETPSSSSWEAHTKNLTPHRKSRPFPRNTYTMHTFRKWLPEPLVFPAIGNAFSRHGGVLSGKWKRLGPSESYYKAVGSETYLIFVMQTRKLMCNLYAPRRAKLTMSTTFREGCTASKFTTFS